MDIEKRIDDLEKRLLRLESRYSQSNPVDVLEMRALKKEIARLKELVEKTAAVKN
jgi:ribosomal protein L29